MFPFGHPHGGFLERLAVSMSPAWGKNVQNLLTDTHTKEVMVNRMFRDLTIQLADAGDPLDWHDELAVMEVLEEAEKRTENFFVFRVAAGLFSPTSTTVLSPYEPLVQRYRELEQQYDFKEAQMRFLDEYGPDFFALTGRMSQLNDGVRATIENEGYAGESGTNSSSPCLLGRGFRAASVLWTKTTSSRRSFTTVSSIHLLVRGLT